MLRGVSQKAKRNFSFLVVAVATISLLTINFLLPINKSATNAALPSNITKSTTTDWAQGTNSGVDTTSDEVKLSAATGWENDNYGFRKQLTVAAKSSNTITKGHTLNLAGVGSASFEPSGTGSYFDLGNSFNNISLPISVEAWINTQAAETAIFMTDSLNGGSYYGVWFFVDANKKVSINYGDGGGATVNDRRSKISNTAIELNKWTHVAGVIRGATDMSLYIDGVDAGGTYSGAGSDIVYSSSSSYTTRIGAWNAGSPHTKGNFDELRIWSKARTQADIVADMNKEIIPQDNLEGYYNFNQTTGNLIDNSGHNITGTLAGNAAYSPYSNVWGGLNTKTLVDAGKIRSDGNDLRLFYGSTEIERELIPATGKTLATSEATQVLFKAQAEVAGGATDNNYYLYYGDSDATDPVTSVYDKKMRVKNAYIQPSDGATNNSLQYNADNFPTNGDGTLELWYKWSNTVGKSWGDCLFKGDEAKNWCVFYDRSAYRLRVSMGNSTVTPTGTNNNAYDWNHIVLTWHNTDTVAQLRVYENNALTFTSDEGTKITNWPTYLKIWDAWSSYDGIELGHMAVYNTVKDAAWVASQNTRTTAVPVTDGARDASATFIHNFDGSGLDATADNGGYASGTATAASVNTVMSGDYRLGDTNDERASNSWVSGVYYWYDDFFETGTKPTSWQEYGRANTASGSMVLGNDQRIRINKANIPTNLRMEADAKGTSPKFTFNDSGHAYWNACADQVTPTLYDTGDINWWPRNDASIFISSSSSSLIFSKRDYVATKKIYVDIDTPGNFSGLTWQYWNGTAWTDFTPTDGTSGFTKSGIIDFTSIYDSLSGTNPPTVGACNFSGQTYQRFIKVSATGVTTPAKMNIFYGIYDYAENAFTNAANTLAGDLHTAAGNTAITRDASSFKKIGMSKTATTVKSYYEGWQTFSTTGTTFDNTMIGLSSTTDATYDNFKVYKTLANEPSASDAVESAKYTTGSSYASPTSTADGSGIIDLGWIGGWGSPSGFTASVNVPTNTSLSFSVRSSAVGGTNDSDWTEWGTIGEATPENVTNGVFAVSTASMPAITLGTNRYLQTKVVFNTTDGVSTPTLSDYTINYVGDADAPSNPTVSALTVAGTSVGDGTWTNLNGAVSASFSGAVDPGTESGLKGYYVYFGTNDVADPLTAGVYQAHQGAAGDVQTFNSSISTSDDGKYYYLIIKTSDIARNVSDSSLVFTFGYDSSAPARPSFVSPSPAGYTTNNSFNFSWPAVEDTKTANGWYNNSWTKRQKVTFDHTKVSNSDQTDFPVLVKITDTNNELFATAKTNGYDILFTSANGTTKLSHEIEKYDVVTHELWAWVKLPVLSHTIDTNIYMYYGNAAAANQQNKTDVWSNGYAGVWHGNDATTSTIADSTVNSYAGSKTTSGEPLEEDGKISKAQTMDGANDYIQMPGLDSYANGRSSISLSVWWRSDAGLTGANNISGWWYNQACHLWIDGSGMMSFRYQTTGGTRSLTKSWDYLNDRNWHHVVGTYNTTNGGALYVDGQLIQSAMASGNLQSQDRFSIGAYKGTGGEPGGFFDGAVDETKLSSVIRSADWIATEYANQNDPETFATIASSGIGSGLKNYEYKRGADEAWSHTADASTRTVTGIQAYQEGVNVFYVRAVDNAGNVSADQQVTYYWSGAAPAKPNNLTVSPETSDSNSFEISWDKSAVGQGEPEVVGYYYSINATPTLQNVTYVQSQDARVTVGPSPFATLQGTNTVYVVGVNSAGNLSFESDYVASTTFSCLTPAPPAPTSVALYDSSDRVLSRWMLTIQWVAGISHNADVFSHYSVERSTNGTDFSPLATTTSTAYIDSQDLNNSTTYFYRIKEVDNAGKESAASSIVQKQPAGKYLAPPTFLSQPKVSNIKSNGAKISWTTDRASTSVVRYSNNANNLAFSTGSFENTTNHEITLLGLKPSSHYYFEVQSLDEDRDYSPEDAYSDAFSFITLPAPAISDVKVENITLTSADLSFQTTTVSNSLINYGQSTSYNLSIEDKSGDGTTSHRVKISNLASGTVYHFKIKGTDIDGNSLISDDYSFETLSPPKIDGLKITPIEGEASYTAKVQWSTNVETTTILRYSTDGKSDESVSTKMTKDHEVIITNLTDNVTYSIDASGRDQFGNETNGSSLQIKTPEDSRPPKISNLNVEVSINGNSNDAKSQIIVSWQTDEPAKSQVEYGEGTGSEGYSNSTRPNELLTLDHLVVISDLDNQKPYHIRAVSHDKANNPSYSENTVVVTKKPKTAALDVVIDALTKSLGFLSKLFKY